MSSQLEVLPRSMLGPLAQQQHRVNQATIERTSHNGAATRVIQLACNVLEWKFDFLAIRRRRRYLLTSGISHHCILTSALTLTRITLSTALGF